jgi:hypothetical protein
VARFEVVAAEHPADAKPRWAVLDTVTDLVVANFATRPEAEAHAVKLESGPLDLDEQDAWKDEDWGEWEKWD